MKKTLIKREVLDFRTMLEQIKSQNRQNWFRENGVVKVSFLKNMYKKEAIHHE